MKIAEANDDDDDDDCSSGGHTVFIYDFDGQPSRTCCLRVVCFLFGFIVHCFVCFLFVWCCFFCFFYLFLFDLVLCALNLIMSSTHLLPSPLLIKLS